MISTIFLSFAWSGMILAAIYDKKVGKFTWEEFKFILFRNFVSLIIISIAFVIAEQIRSSLPLVSITLLVLAIITHRIMCKIIKESQKEKEFNLATRKKLINMLLFRNH